MRGLWSVDGRVQIKISAQYFRRGGRVRGASHSLSVVLGILILPSGPKDWPFSARTAYLPVYPPVAAKNAQNGYARQRALHEMLVTKLL